MDLYPLFEIHLVAHLETFHDFGEKNRKQRVPCRNPNLPLGSLNFICFICFIFGASPAFKSFFAMNTIVQVLVLI